MNHAVEYSAQAPRRCVSIVTPFYNEADVVAMYFTRLGEVLRPLAAELDFELVCVNDGSRDSTLAELVATQPPVGRLVIVDLSRNFGKEAALSVGLDFATGDAVAGSDSATRPPRSRRRCR